MRDVKVREGTRVKPLNVVAGCIARLETGVFDSTTDIHDFLLCYSFTRCKIHTIDNDVFITVFESPIFVMFK